MQLIIYSDQSHMAKFFVSIVVNHRKNRICKDDIKNVFSHKPRRLPKLPAFLSSDEKTHEEDGMTSCEELETQFEPIQFFPAQSVRGE